MHNLFQDLRFSIRQLRKSPGFALTTILTLALGIGATTGIFSLVNAVLLRPLPFPEPDRLMHLAARESQDGNPGSAEPQLSRLLRLAQPESFVQRDCVVITTTATR